MSLKTFLGTCAAIALASTAAAAPGLISYQGQLTDPSGDPITTPVEVTFTFHDAPSGGSPLAGFSDTDTVTPDANGIYSTFVGDEGDEVPSSVFDNDEVWLNVNVEGEDLVPRVRVTSSGFAIRAASADDASTLQGLDASSFLSMEADAYVVVRTTSDAAQNGANLVAAYETAKSLTPNGEALAADNRAVVMVAPGNYDLGAGSFTLDADFVDLVGLSSARDNQYIFGSEHVLVQTAHDVRIENLVLHYTGTDTATHAYNPIATWNSGANTGSSPETVIRNCEIRGDEIPMRPGIWYAGTYEDVHSGNQAFGGDYGIVSGTFINCTAGDDSFGGAGSIVSGTFTNCKAGDFSFGGIYGESTGVFTNCLAGVGSFSGVVGYATGGRFYYCVGGIGSFTFMNSSDPPRFLFCVLDGEPYYGNN